MIFLNGNNNHVCTNVFAKHGLNIALRVLTKHNSTHVSCTPISRKWWLFPYGLACRTCILLTYFQWLESKSSYDQRVHMTILYHVAPLLCWMLVHRRINHYSPSIKFAGTYLYTRVEKGTVKQSVSTSARAELRPLHATSIQLTNHVRHNKCGLIMTVSNEQLIFVPVARGSM